MISTTLEKIIEAYFKGGNAKDKTDTQLKDILKAIIEVIKEEEDKPRDG